MSKILKRDIYFLNFEKKFFYKIEWIDIYFYCLFILFFFIGLLVFVKGMLLNF